MHRTTTTSAMPQQWPQLTRLQLNKYEKVIAGTGKRATGGAPLDSARSKGSVASTKQAAVRDAEQRAKSPAKK